MVHEWYVTICMEFSRLHNPYEYFSLGCSILIGPFCAIFVENLKDLLFFKLKYSFWEKIFLLAAKAGAKKANNFEQKKTRERLWHQKYTHYPLVIRVCWKQNSISKNGKSPKCSFSVLGVTNYNASRTTVKREHLTHIT